MHLCHIPLCNFLFFFSFFLLFFSLFLINYSALYLDSYDYHLLIITPRFSDTDILYLFWDILLSDPQPTLGLHSLGSGRISKVFLENPDVNSFKYSGIGGDSALELALKASASCWEMVKDAMISAEEGRGNRPVAKIWSASSRDSGGTSELSWSEELELMEESESWSISGMGPAVQVCFCWLSTFGQHADESSYFHPWILHFNWSKW